MARYTKLFHSIWADPDFVALTTDAKTLYLLLISQPDITACGVLPYTPRRWRRLLPDRNQAQIGRAAAQLVASSFIVIDEDTEELWVRSYVRYDELHKVPNGRTSINNAFLEVVSGAVRDLIETTIEAIHPGTLDERVPPRVDERVGSPQQQQPIPIPKAAAAAEPPPDTAAAAAEDPNITEAIELVIEHRLLTEHGVRDETRYAQKIRRELPVEYAARLATCHPPDDHDTPARWLATNVFGLTRSQVVMAASALNRRRGAA